MALFVMIFQPGRSPAPVSGTRQETADDELNGVQVTQTTADDYADTIPSETYGYPMDGDQAACAAGTGGVFGRVAAAPALSAEVGGKPAGQNKAPPPPLPADASQPPASSSSQTTPSAGAAASTGASDPLSKKNTQKRPPTFPPATAAAAALRVRLASLLDLPLVTLSQFAPHRRRGLRTSGVSLARQTGRGIRKDVQCL